MSILKFNQFDDDLNEMAKAYPKGSYVKIIGDIHGTTDTGRPNVGVGKNFGYPADISTVKGTDENDGFFYMEIVGSARKFLEGNVIIWNNLESSHPYKNKRGYPELEPNVFTRDSSIRINVSLAAQPGIEWKYIQPKLDDIKALKGKKFFFSGSETNLFDAVGKEMSPDRGTFTFDGTNINFALTKIHKEPVLMLKHVQLDDYAFVKLSEVANLKGELGDAQYKSFATWFSEKLDIHVEWSSEAKNFKASTIFVKTENISNTYSGSSSIGPFFSEKEANAVKEAIDALKGPSCFKSTHVEIIEKAQWSDRRTTFSLDELISYAKKYGVQFDADEILNAKSSSIRMNKMKEEF